MTDKQHIIKMRQYIGQQDVQRLLSSGRKIERRAVVRIIKKCVRVSGYCMLADILKALAGRGRK